MKLYSKVHAQSSTKTMKIYFSSVSKVCDMSEVLKPNLGEWGERGCRSQRRHQTSDKNRLICQMVVFIVHQLYKNIYSKVIDHLFTLV